MNHDANLLFGVFAVQLQKITPEQLAEAASMWAIDPSRGLAEQLVETGAMTESGRELIARLVNEAIAAHEGNAAQTLESFGGGEHIYDSFMGCFLQAESGIQVSGSNAERPEVTVASEDGVAVREVPGRYKEKSEQGRGGMGRVLLVHDEALGREIVMKELLPRPNTVNNHGEASPVRRSGSIMARFLQEARITGQLTHPSIVPVYELGRRQDDTLYYTMKLVRGQTLAAKLKEAKNHNQRVALLSHFADLCQAMAYAHSRGVIHRDLKPQNVMVGEFGETVVIDWGLAKVKGQEDAHAAEMEETFQALQVDSKEPLSRTASGEALGTPAYMPPEQAVGRIEQIDERSDVYSLGAVLYEILTGAPPFTGGSAPEILSRVVRESPPSIHDLEPDAPLELAAICARAMRKDPEERYQSASEIAEDVERFLSGALVDAYDYHFSEHLKRFMRQHRTALVTAAVGLLALFAISIWSYARLVRDRAEAIDLRELAQHAEMEAVAAQEQANLERYYTTVALAATQVEQQRFGFVPQLLESCPRELRGWEWHYLLSLCNREDRLLQAHQRHLRAMDLSSGGRLLATADGWEELTVWDADTLELKWRYDEPIDVQAAAFHPRNAYLVVVVREHGPRGSRYRLEILDVETGQALEEPIPLLDNPLALEFAPDGNTLYIGTHVSALMVIDTQTWRLRQLLEDQKIVFAVAVSPDGRWVASGDSSSRIIVRDTETLTPHWDFVGHRHQIFAMTFDAFSERLISASHGVVCVWDVAKREQIMEEPLHTQPIFSIAPSPDGTTFVTGSTDGTGKMVRASDGEHVGTLHNGISIQRITFTPDGAALVTGGRDGAVRFWSSDLSTRRESHLELGVPELHTGTVVSFSSDGALLAGTGWEIGAIGVWDTSDFSLVRQIEFEGMSERFLRFVPGTHQLAVSFADGIRVYTLDDLAVALELPADGLVKRGRFDQLGARLAVSYENGGIHVFDVATRQPLPLESAPNSVVAVTLSPDGSLLAAGSWVGTDTWVWQLPEGQLMHRLNVHTDRIKNVEFHPEGDILATASRDGDVALWEVSSGSLLRVIKGHTDTVSGLTFSPDGRRLATGGFDNSLRIWDPRTGHQLLYLPNARYFALDAEFSPDGQLLASTDSSLPIRVRTTGPIPAR